MLKRLNTNKYITIGFMIGGVLLLAAALLLTIYNVWDKRRAEEAAASVLAQLHEQWEEVDSAGQGHHSSVPDYLLNPAMEMQTITIDGYSYIGTITIPSLDLELPVMESFSNEQLKTAPCRYHGSPYSGHFIIAAHNYTSHFGKLKNITVGDKIIFTDMEQNVFRYQAERIETLSGRAVKEMTSGEWDLTLFTCTLSGAERITIRCKAISPYE
ncbi:MAG: sortase [Clostridiales bacterium]|nr:sortase [Clostridiales bacterium]